MLEMPAFARRRSSQTAPVDDGLYKTDSVHSTSQVQRPDTSRNSSFAQRVADWTASDLSGTRSTPELLNGRSARPRSFILDLGRTDRRNYWRSQPVNSPRANVDESTYRRGYFHEEPVSPVTDRSEVSSLEATMSAPLLKTVAKKASHKSLLCGKSDSSDGDAIDMDAVVKLLNELQKRASPDELVALHKALLPTKTTEPMNPASPTPRSAFSRRSSISTPGLATRLLSPRRVSNEHMNKSPTPQDTLVVPKIDPPARPVSPAGLDTIGGLKLGTLRVTNGTVSPESSVPSDIGNIDGASAAAAIPPQPLHTATEDEDEEVASGTITPKAPQSDQAPRLSLCVIPGLELYDDSSSDDDIATTPTRPAPLFHGKYVRPLDDVPIYSSHAFNDSADSLVSRLSTIQDVDSIAEGRFSPPAPVAEQLKPIAETRSQPPSSSGSDGSYLTALGPAPVPLGSHPRPALGQKSDSGYSSQSTQLPPTIPDRNDARQSQATIPQIPQTGAIVLDSIPSQGTLEALETVKTNGATPTPLASPSTEATTNQFSLATSTPTSELSLNPVALTGQSMDSIATMLTAQTASPSTPDIAGRQRRKLYKPPPLMRSESSQGFTPMASPTPVAETPTETYFSFARRLSRLASPMRSENNSSTTVNADGTVSPQQRRRRSFGFSPRPKPDALKSPKTPQTAFNTPVLSQDTSESPMASSQVGSGEKRRSRFRLRGRSRSNSMVRPETNLPKESETPTVADTITRPASSMEFRMAPIQAPTKYDYQEHRSSSVPRAAKGADRRHSLVMAPVRQEQQQRPQRQRSVSIAAPEMPLRKPVPSNSSISIAATPEPTIASTIRAASEERRNTLSRPFPWKMSSDRGHDTPDTTNPAYIASRFSSPPPEPKQRPPPPPHPSHRPPPVPPKPRYIPWDDDKPAHRQPLPPRAMTADEEPRTLPTRGKPLENMDINAVSWIMPAAATDDDKDYRAYRASDAISMTKLITSPTKPDQRAPAYHRASTGPGFRIASDESKPRRWSQLSSTPSPNSLFDRYGGGLDYGWERGSGFSASAGTRYGNSGPRRGVQYSEIHGVDLSDVPVMVNSGIRAGRA